MCLKYKWWIGAKLSQKTPNSNEGLNDHTRKIQDKILIN